MPARCGGVNQICSCIRLHALNYMLLEIHIHHVHACRCVHVKTAQVNTHTCTCTCTYMYNIQTYRAITTTLVCLCLCLHVCYQQQCTVYSRHKPRAREGPGILIMYMYIMNTRTVSGKAHRTSCPSLVSQL